MIKGIPMPMKDTMFKYLFGYNKNIKYTEYLLECLFNLEEGTLEGKLEILNSLVLDKDVYNDKNFEIDVRIIIKDINGKNIYVDLEPYTTYQITSILKSFAYICKMYISQFKVGDNLTEPNILYQFNIIKGNKESDTYTITGNKTNKDLFDKLNKMFIGNINEKDIFKYIEIYISDEEGYSNYNEKAKRMFKFLNSNNMKEAEENAKGDEKLMEMVKESKRFIEEDDYSWIEKKYQDYLAKERLAKERKLGIVEGTKQGIIKTAYSLLRYGMDKEQVKEITGLTDEDLK